MYRMLHPRAIALPGVSSINRKANAAESIAKEEDLVLDGDGSPRWKYRCLRSIYPLANAYPVTYALLFFVSLAYIARQSG